MLVLRQVGQERPEIALSSGKVRLSTLVKSPDRRATQSKKQTELTEAVGRWAKMKAPRVFCCHRAPQRGRSKYIQHGDVLADAEALYETSASKGLINDHTAGVRHLRALVKHTSGKRALSEHTLGEHTVAIDQTPSDLSAEQSTEKPKAEQSSIEPAVSEPSSSGDTPASGEQASGEKNSAEKPSGDKPPGDKPPGDKPSGDKPSGDKPPGDKPPGDKPSSDKPSSDKPSGDQAPGDKGGAETTTVSSTVTNPVLNCHICSYMNDQKKCLHGEGVCTTQKSQQCMLKKIFEGGKLQYMVQACENMCPSMNLFSHGTRMQITCCHHQSFCNKV
ncbi:acrosomal protein SP-10 [Suncus etruscus]|uniref:acrosomal protein SP-10 n=1 Tax=Suncus etruscus TaxID=109475 RepID=UPI0021106E84|nr:acrosomal protein SP-10 [Suncus etruscus]